MTAIPRSYVGITGFMHRSEVSDLVQDIPHQFFRKRDLMVGVLVSSKTLIGEPSESPGRYPQIKNVASIFNRGNGTLNLIHYHTDTPGKLGREMIEASKWAGTSCDGFQINACWPPINQVAYFREQWPGARIVLQIGRKALEETDYDGIKITKRLSQYISEAKITDILYDPSSGRGIPGDINQAAETLSVLQELPVGIGYAGGLGFGIQKDRELRRLIDLIPNLSIDAEGRMRRHDLDPRTAPLDPYLAHDYLKKALQMF